ncbi:hypothetical protein [uncultured Subdoligranulum sp.]|uniref:hypothetical protein n=1 Tax=uncultured Subdoligranulum sp. TaxID=512298 RepID=UPI0025CC76D0|nr:hypothetical protein [uncultured Subdoligranulum sp.]
MPWLKAPSLKVQIKKEKTARGCPRRVFSHKGRFLQRRIAVFFGLAAWFAQRSTPETGIFLT